MLVGGGGCFLNDRLSMEYYHGLYIGSLLFKGSDKDHSKIFTHFFGYGVEIGLQMRYVQQ
jgi:hypothetical protein